MHAPEPKSMSRLCMSSILQVLGSNSSLDEFVTSTDSQGGLLHLTLNVTGAQGLPSDEGVKVSLLDEANTTLYTESVKSAKGGDAPAERTVSLKLRQPPGECCCCCCCCFHLMLTEHRGICRMPCTPDRPGHVSVSFKY